MGGSGSGSFHKIRESGSEEYILFFLTFSRVFAVSEEKGKLEKMSIRTSSIYFVPATVALRK
jgi:hypothetical protein